MSVRPLNNEVKNLLDCLSGLQKGFEQKTLDERQEFLVFLSRIISLLEHKPIEKEIVTLLGELLETEAINSIDSWLEIEMASELIN